MLPEIHTLTPLGINLGIPSSIPSGFLHDFFSKFIQGCLQDYSWGSSRNLFRNSPRISSLIPLGISSLVFQVFSSRNSFRDSPRIFFTEIPLLIAPGIYLVFSFQHYFKYSYRHSFRNSFDEFSRIHLGINSEIFPTILY